MSRDLHRPMGGSEGSFDSDEKILAYISAAFEEGDLKVIVSAIGDVVRETGTTRLARQTGLSREHLYRALSPKGNPEFGTVVRVLAALGIKLFASSSHQRCTAIAHLGRATSVPER